MAINPFKSVLFNTFVRERGHAVRIGASGATGENEQLVWVLWKILKGDGNDVSPNSPNVFASTSRRVHSGTIGSLDWSVFSQHPGTVSASA